ncbi:hypothetical protein FHX82_005102 [Amycolatopsis bartoniae]|nr:hypothetical protein [Amycolatopsis bartoniae]MBB2938026.1 hypothetical protein [Amycolatopsis bartoniae]
MPPLDGRIGECRVLLVGLVSGPDHLGRTGHGLSSVSSRGRW